MTARPGPWPVEHATGSAAAFHDRDLPDPVGPAVWWFDVERPTVVLGSTQPDDLVDRDRAAVAGVEVVRRRSGGGAVWLAPGEALWVDVLVPSTDPRWELDVGRSALWVGRAWVDALRAVGRTDLDLAVHDGAMARTPWSDRVCFAGLAPGEVTLGGRKVLGISQRRTRAGARFQCALLLAWDPAPLAEVLALGPDERRALVAGCRNLAVGIGPTDPRPLVAALADRSPS